MRDPGPRRLHLGREPTTACSATTAAASGSTATATASRACGSTSSTKRRTAASTSRRRRGSRATRTSDSSSSMRRTASASFRSRIRASPRMPPARCTSEPIGASTSDAQDRFQFDAEANAVGTGPGDRRPRRSGRGRLLLARWPAVPQGVGPDRGVRPSARPAHRRDARRYPDRRRRTPLGPDGQAALRARPGTRSASSATTRGFRNRAKSAGWRSTTSGGLLVPTVQGLASRDGGRWRLIGRREGLPVDTALAAIVDREGSLWVGLLGGGLSRRLGHGQITNWSTADGLSHDVIWAVTRQKSKSGPGPDLGRHGAGSQPHRSGDRRDPRLTTRRTASRETSSTRSPPRRTAASGRARGPAA